MPLLWIILAYINDKRFKWVSLACIWLLWCLFTTLPTWSLEKSRTRNRSTTWNGHSTSTPSEDAENLEIAKSMWAGTRNRSITWSGLSHVEKDNNYSTLCLVMYTVPGYSCYMRTRCTCSHCLVFSSYLTYAYYYTTGRYIYHLRHDIFLCVNIYECVNGSMLHMLWSEFATYTSWGPILCIKDW